MSSANPSSLIAEVLRQPDDLLKLAAYRKKLLKEKSALDTKLSEGVKSQLDATRDALLKLQNSRAAVTLIREEMLAVEKLMGREEGGDAFDKITRVGSLSFRCLEPADKEARFRRYIATLHKRRKWYRTSDQCLRKWITCLLYLILTGISTMAPRVLRLTSCPSTSNYNNWRHSVTRLCIKPKSQTLKIERH